MTQRQYIVKKVNGSLDNFTNDTFWNGIAVLKITDYLWIPNNYKPDVFIQVLYSDDYFYLKFNVMEEKISIRYTNINDPVYKDSCVEFFINLFPEITEEYFNFEFNALGVLKLGYGIRRNRFYLNEFDFNEIKVVSSIKNPLVGFHGSDRWILYSAIPIRLLEKITNRKFAANDAIGNFYKCGDETEFKHYGMWNIIDNLTPDFHLPEYFGKIVFQK